jgi:hypothetical protein
MPGFLMAGTAHPKLWGCEQNAFVLTASATICLGKLRGEAHVRFRAPTEDKVQNERHYRRDKKNMNEPARDMKENPATKPGDH